MHPMKCFFQSLNFVGFPFFIPHENLCSRSHGKKPPSAAASINKRGLMLNLLFQSNCFLFQLRAQRFFVLLLPLWALFLVYLGLILKNDSRKVAAHGMWMQSCQNLPKMLHMNLKQLYLWWQRYSQHNAWITVVQRWSLSRLPLNS